MTLNLLGLTFHLYGLILGLAMVAAFYLAEKKAAQHDLPQDCVWKLGGVAVLLGLIGARLWHVVTDFHLYSGKLLSASAIWEGGMSIFGGVGGGILGLALARRIVPGCRQRPVAFYTDLAAFALPAAQGIGRLANWVNGELYGLPTKLPWRIFIAPEDRLPGYEDIAYYHPLFLYEMVLMIGFSFWIWTFDRKNNDNQLQVGSGFYTWIYLGFYSLVRFGLDFIRLDKAAAFGTALGINQLILAVFLLILAGHGLKKGFLRSSGKPAAVLFSIFIIAASAWGLSQTNHSLTHENIKNLSEFQLGDHKLQVEVVSEPEDLALGLSGRKEIGADGMLFVFPSPTRPTFWMKEMLFDLDMIWIRNGEVVDITYNVPKPEPGTNLSDLPRYSPRGPANMILEVPAGKAVELNISTGSAAALVK